MTYAKAGGDTPKILERVRAEYKQEAERDLVAERAEHDKTKASREAAEAAQRKLAARQERLYTRITQISAGLGRIARWLTFIFFFACIAVASFLVGEVGQKKFEIPRKYSVPTLILILAVVGHLLMVTHEVFGFSVKDLAEKFSDQVQLVAFRRIEGFLFQKSEHPLISLRLSEAADEDYAPLSRTKPSDGEKG